MSTEENKLTGSEVADATLPAGATSPANEQELNGQAAPIVQPTQTTQPIQQSTAASATAPTRANDQRDQIRRMTDDDEDEDAPSEAMDFGAMLDQFEQEQSAYQEGEVVRGTVIKVTERGVMIDFGFKSEGLVPQEEFADGGTSALKPGEEIEVLVKSMDSSEGLPILSHADAMRMRTWDELEAAYQNETPIKGRVAERVKGGLRVDIKGIAAFLPGSQIDVRPVRNLESLRDQEIEARVIKLNRKRANVVLSRKAILEETTEARKSETLGSLEEGVIIEGQVKNLTDYGAFVDLGGVDGLLHVTDMSWGRLQNPSDMFNVGDNVQAKVLKFDRERARVSLGYKQLLPDPWESVEERYHQGERINGKVASVTDYGAFIELEPGVEGLVHVSEMSWSKRMKHPSKLVQPGDEVEAEILNVDGKARRISLGMKQIQENPWQSIASRFEVGSRVKGRVRNLTDFGAFVEIEDGVDGLVHVSDISWTKRIKHPAEALKKGQDIEAVITNIDTENRRLSLSIKDLEPSAWEQFTTQYKPGDIVKGRITRFANFGVFVELAEGLEGLCHVSELSDERVERPEDVVKIGDALDFRILRIEEDSKKVGLSARASVKEEPVVDTRTYSTERGGGMASLAELADFGFGREEKEEENEQ